MDDTEFRKRALSEPRSEDPELQDAARGNSARERLMAEAAELEERISDTIKRVSVPTDLADRLKKHASSPIAGSGSRNPLRYLAIAATLFVAAAITLVPGMINSPSAQDLAFHDHLVNHLHSEAGAYAGNEQADWNNVHDIIRSGGGQVQNDARLRDATIKFARDCDLGEFGRGTHLVMQGEHGPVSVIYTSSRPVNTVIDIQDNRFRGRIIPLQNGNLAIAGEEGESLSGYEQLVTASLDWSVPSD